MDSPTIMFLDDEQYILNSIKRLLLDDSYNTIFCNTVCEAREIINNKKIDIIISDERMPDTFGSVFLEEIKEKHPDTIGIIMSGYTDIKPIEEKIKNGTIFKFISKPWEIDEFYNILDECINKYNSLKDNNIQN